MFKRRVDLLFKNFPNEYPHHLEKGYSRILEKLMHLWAKPEFELYIQELLFNSRADRQGFPQNVVDELLFIHKLHDMCREKNISLPPIIDVWSTLPGFKNTPLAFQAALMSGDLARIQNYLSAGISVDYRFEDEGSTPLILASSSNQLAVASLLIQLGANVDARDNAKSTSLHWAVYYGNADLASLLLQNGADVNVQKNNGVTPLILSIMRNKIHMVEFLLQHGARVDLQCNEGSPKDVAFKKNAKDIFNLLVLAERNQKQR